MTTKTALTSVDEALKKAAQHGQQEHGRKEFNEDILEGVRAKTRDVKSPQIRGAKADEKPVADPKEAQKRKALARWESEGGPPDQQRELEQ